MPQVSYRIYTPQRRKKFQPSAGSSANRNTRAPIRRNLLDALFLRIIFAAPLEGPMAQRKIHCLALSQFVFVLILATCSNSHAQNPPAAEPQEKPASSGKIETCSIQGTVVAAGGGEALRGARLVLAPVGDGQSPSPLRRDSGPHAQASFASTDGDGHFVISGVPPGRYNFQASKTGYVAQGYRPDGNEGSQTLLDLVAGQKLEKVQFKLRRAAVILGRITDENGEPAVGVQVEALVSKPGLEGFGAPSLRGQWFPMKVVATNDLGEYRIYGLPPGNYYVAAIDSGLGDVAATMAAVTLASRGLAVYGGGVIGSRGLVTVSTPHPALYYPGVTQRSQAQKIRLAAGQEMRIDIALVTQKTVTVSGRVLGPNGTPAPQTTVMIRPQNLEGAFSSMRSMGTTDAQGYFEIKEVMPGSYVAWANGSFEGKDLSTEQPLEVAAEDVTGLRLQLGSGHEISGRIIVPAGSKLDLSETVVLLSPGQGLHNTGFAEIREDHTFTTADVPPGTYSVMVNNLPDGWYISSADFGGENVLERGLKLSEATAGRSLDVTLKSGTGKLEGTVLKGNDPIAGAMVRLVPERPSEYRPGLERTAATDQRGHFVIADVVPGSYRALAASHEENEGDDEGDEPAVADSSTTTVAVAEGESKTVQLKLKTSEP
jgi:protocatechuate 3,4-dioxygenase beta subunit